ncbi:exosortase A [Sabulicella rubraurantiaca]|uniref:exosortase A n=1 Tax=Sabulicella rubraurantiaca TaxID=2811429 RepID=UPI001A9776EC|nr:exosortase A [Sabulicella rubraurantiaca]
MSTATLPMPPVPVRATWTASLLVLLPALAVLLFVFREEAANAVHIWTNTTAYNHGWVVLPIAAWLAWERRDRLRIHAPRPAPAFGLLAIPLVLAWLAAERLGIMEGRQLAVLGLCLILVPVVLGWRLTLAFAGPLAFLIFLVPFGEWAVPTLQAMAAWLVDIGLDLTGIPHHVDALMIEAPSGSFYVAEACAGLRFMVATLAFGAVYALTMFRSPGRRLVVLALSVIVPILSNAVRIVGLIVVAEWQGSAASVAADHLIYGWFFFLLVIVLVLLAGLPFREAPARPVIPATPPVAQPRPLALALGTVLVVVPALVATAAAARLEGLGGGAPTNRPLPLQAIPGCELEGEALRCPGGVLSARTLVFPPAAEWDSVARERRTALGAVEDQDLTFDITAGPVRWRARQPHSSADVLAAAAFLDGRQAGDGIRSRARQALRALRDTGDGRPVVAVVHWRGEPGSDPTRGRAWLREVMEAQGEALAARAIALSRGE